MPIDFLKIAGCQVPDVRGDPGRAMEIVRTMSAEAAARGAGLVTFPECFLQGYDVAPAHVRETAIDLSSGEFSNMMRALQDIDVVVVLGLIERDSWGCYNSAVISRRGEMLARYRKKNLTNSEQAVFRAGTETPIVDVDGVKVSVNICYDLQFPEGVLAAARAGARVLACPCNNMLRRSSAEQWKSRHNEIRSTRARESDVWLVSSDVTGWSGERVSFGPTAIIGPDGIVRTQVPLLTEGIALWEAH